MKHPNHPDVVAVLDRLRDRLKSVGVKAYTTGILGEAKFRISLVVEPTASEEMKKALVAEVRLAMETIATMIGKPELKMREVSPGTVEDLPPDVVELV